MTLSCLWVGIKENVSFLVYAKWNHSNFTSIKKQKKMKKKPHNSLMSPCRCEGANAISVVDHVLLVF